MKRLEHIKGTFLYQIKHSLRTGIYKRGIRTRKKYVLRKTWKKKEKKTYEKTRQPNNNSDINHTYSNNSIFNTRTTIPPVHRKITPSREYWLKN